MNLCEDKGACGMGDDADFGTGSGAGGGGVDGRSPELETSAALSGEVGKKDVISC